jgi:hypothetical protein
MTLRGRPSVLCVLLLLGCSSGPRSGASPGEAEGGASLAADAGASLEMAETSIGPIDVPAGVEKTVCIEKRLGNADDFFVSSITGDLAPGSHHLVVYRTSHTEESLTPTDCMPFRGIAVGEATPLIVITNPHLTWKLPTGVGIRMQTNQMLRIEAHYLNASSADLQGQAKVTLTGAPVSSAPLLQEAELLVWGTTNISIAAQSTFSTGLLFQAGVPGTHFFSVLTHEHRLGTRMQVWASAAPGDTSRQLADDTDWANPTWRSLDHPIDFDGTNGLSFQCDWSNTTDQTVVFGESALQEMCFVLGYHYPSNGKVDVCLDGQCLYRNLDGGNAD